MAQTDLVLAITGASGSPYAVRLLELLLRAGRNVHLSISPAAVEVIERELERTIRLDRFDLADLLGDTAREKFPGQLHYHQFQNFQAVISRASCLTGGHSVVPRITDTDVI